MSVPKQNVAIAIHSPYTTRWRSLRVRSLRIRFGAITVYPFGCGILFVVSAAVMSNEQQRNRKLAAVGVKSQRCTSSFMTWKESTMVVTHSKRQLMPVKQQIDHHEVPTQ